MENNETWREKFDKKFNYLVEMDNPSTGATTTRQEEVKDFFAAELLSLADKIGAEKIRPDAAMYIAEASSVKTKNAPFDSGFDFGCRTALDTAISLIKEMAK